jgi:hypothetical protein
MRKQIAMALFLPAALLVANCAKSEDAAAAKTGCDAKVDATISNGATISGYLGNTTVPGSATVNLSGKVTVCSGSTQTIGAGTTLKADTSKLTYLLVERGATINAIGTATSPHRIHERRRSRFAQSI